MNDKDFLSQFDNLELDPQNFNHASHLRLAWLTLRQCPAEQACKKLEQGIKRFANHHGANEKYHRSITWALTYIVDARMREQGADQFDVFLSENPDLANDAKAVLSLYYTPEVLDSDRARHDFVQPDLMSWRNT
jgi:hypothetical protein